MRLFDKCLTNMKDSPFKRKMIKDAPFTTVIAVDSIASYYWMSSVADWGYEQFPYAMPPWDTCFLEYNEPPKQNDGHGNIVDNPDGLQQGGVFCKLIRDKKTLQAIRDDALQMLPADATHEQRRAIVECALIGVGIGVECVRGITVEWPFTIKWFFKDDGTPLLHLYSGNGLAQLPPVAQDELINLLQGYHHIALLTFTFANCCNVKLQDVTEDLQPDPKIRRRLKIPDVKRYTLNIAGHYTKPSRNANEPQQGIMPFHLCRGHFATYTAEKPMFGNPKLVGRFWHPPHMKGKKENGVIEKDYAIAE